MDIRFRWLIPLLSDVCLMVAGILDDHLTEERLGSSSFVVFNLLLSCIGIFFTRLTRIVEKNIQQISIPLFVSRVGVCARGTPFA